jgi:hypothetical protein
MTEPDDRATRPVTPPQPQHQHETTEAATYRAERAGMVRPRPLASLVASAQRLTSATVSRQGASAKSWQEDAWEMFDLVGEQRFLASTLANRMSQAKLYVGRIGNADGSGGASQTDAPIPVEDNDAITGVLDAFGDTASARQQILQRMGVNLFVAGDGWLVGIPSELLPHAEPDPATSTARSARSTLTPVLGEDTLALDDLDWRMLSVSEVTSKLGGDVTLQLGESSEEKVECSVDDVWLIRVWRPHPRRWWEADSPTRSSLPVLRELVGLTMHISAQVDSRLAGAGLLIVPQSAQRALKAAAGLPEDAEEDPFTEALLEAMLKPIQDRANASALVPLVVTVPDEAAALFQFLTFAKPLDTESRNLRDEAIRRLALGQDAPPELLLGTGGMNHWGAWLVQEDVVTTHLEPPLALICDALTTQYLWPVLVQQGMTEEQAQTYVVWYDVSDLVVRPNRSTDAIALFDRGVISGDATRGATGFDESDAPAAVEELDPAVTLALELVRSTPLLMQNPGLPSVVAQIHDALTMPAADQSVTSIAPAAPSAGGPTPASGVDSQGGPRTSGPDAVPTPSPAATPADVNGPGIAAAAGYSYTDDDLALVP